MNLRILWEQISGKRGSAARMDAPVIVLSPHGRQLRIKRFRVRDGQPFIETEEA